MQGKVAFDTNIYIGIFNKGLHQKEIDGFNKVMYLLPPVLHKLWIGARGEAEIRHLIRFGNKFISLKRLVQPNTSTQILIGRTCQKLRSQRKLNPKQRRIYNDVCIALLARQIGATLVTENMADFEFIREIVDFKFRRTITDSI